MKGNSCARSSGSIMKRRSCSDRKSPGWMRPASAALSWSHAPSALPRIGVVVGSENSHRRGEKTRYARLDFRWWRVSQRLRQWTARPGAARLHQKIPCAAACRRVGPDGGKHCPGWRLAGAGRDADRRLVRLQRIDGLDRLDLATAVDLTSRVRNGILYWDIPEGNGVSSSLSRPIAAVKNGQKII